MVLPMKVDSSGLKSRQRIFERGPSLFLSVLLFLNFGATLSARTASGFPQEGARSSLQSQSQMETQLLELGKPIERQLAGGEVHYYKITLASGQYAHVVVEQRGVDVVVTLFGPDGKKIVELDSPNGTQGPKHVSVVAEASGDYRLEVRSLEKEAPLGGYEVKIEEQREAKLEDKARIAAKRAVAEGEQLSLQKTAESRQMALKKYEEARTLWQRVGDLGEEAETLSRIGGAYLFLGETQKGLQHYIQSLQIFQTIGNRSEEAKLLLFLGSVLSISHENQKALDVLHQARTIFRDLGNTGPEAGTLLFIGNVYKNTYENQKALDYYGKALELNHAMGNHFAEAATRTAIGEVYAAMGDFHKAIEQFREALPVFQSSGQPLPEASTLESIGGFYAKLGEAEIARDYYSHALSLYRSLGLRPFEARMLKAIGETYSVVGEWQKALDNLTRVLTIFREFSERGAEEADTYVEIGVTYDALGENQKAIDNLTQALKLYRAIEQGQGQADALTRIGAVYLALGEYQKALENLNQALPLTRAGGNRGNEAMTLFLIAHIEHERGDLIEARRRIETALEITESIRTKITSPGWRASYFASNQDYYKFYIDLLMRLHKNNPTGRYDAEALQASERAKARSFLEMLTEARADIREGVDPALLERERTLQQQLNARAEYQFRLLSGKHTEEQAAAVKKEFEVLRTEFQEVQAQIRAKSPRYAALTQPQPLSLKEIQEQVLDEDTLLLEYSLGEERSYLWAVTPTSLTSYELPKRTEIEAAARRQKFEAIDEWLARITKANAEHAEAAPTLSQMILGPVAHQLGKKRLVIVADGVLQYIPFAALPVPRSPGLATGNLRSSSPELRIQNPQPLIVEHEIVSLPSASALAVLRRELAGRKPASKTVAVLADPVFEKDDPRLKVLMASRKSEVAKAEKKTDEQSRGASGDDLRSLQFERSVRQVGVGEGRLPIKRLLFTRQEAEGIVALARTGDGMKALDCQASRQTATSDQLSQYRIVHFATHGLLNSEQPELSGIVLSLVDENGKPQDGFLRAHEVYNLKLPADLVVLSGCKTGLGKEIKGEGLVGLTRGFMYAGAARVMVSLWDVNDAATSELMKRFYRAMLKGGQRPAAALRAAQVSMWKEKRLQSPYYWAAFILQGEWK